MKLLKYMALAGGLMLGMTSCSDWLDVNVDPDNPNNESILVDNRLPWMQKEYTYSAGCANVRTSATCGAFYSNNANMNYAGITWNMASAGGLTTTPYQTWFTGTASNYNDLYNKAEAEGAYHYMAAANVIYVLGFMEMLDLYGEMPFEEALSTSPAPAYSDGKTIYYGCLDKLEEAIELFGRSQESGATPLSMGDMWNGGDTQKWIKMCYGLKARYLLKLSKKAEFDPQAVLDALAKGPQSNSDNTYLACYNVTGDRTDYLLGDPIQANGNWDTGAYGKNQWPSKYYCDMLTNLRGAGVEDPRYSKIIPASMTNITFDTEGKVLTYDWRRSEGIDIYGDMKRLQAGGATSMTVQSIATSDVTKNYTISDATDKANFVKDFENLNYTQVSSYSKMSGRQICIDADTVYVCYPAGAFYVDSDNYVLAGDTIYVNLNSGSAATNNGAWKLSDKDLYYHGNLEAGALTGAVSGTGSFQLRVISDFDLVTYYEMCFIKAEVYMRQSNTTAALQAYKEGIQANIDRMQTKLTQWKAEGYDNPDMWPMDETAITNYMNSAAVCQSAGSLTMQDIMLQKYIAMGISIENYNDMRRFNFSAGNIGSYGVVYPDYGRTKLYAGGAAFLSSEPTNPTSWIRRWRLPATLELSYNGNNALAMNAHAFQDYVWCLPVWWDCATDDEYYSYLK